MLSWPPTLPSTRTLVIAILIVVAVSLAALGGWAWYDASQRRVSAAYAEVSARVQAAEAPDAPAEAKAAAVRELEGWLARYPSGHAVPQAAYDLGNLRFATRNYAGARSAYELALQRGAPELIRALARSGIGRTWEAERDFAKAADAYGALVKDLDPKSFVYEDALIDHARALELAGKKAEAVAVYQKLLKDVPNARRADDVRTRLAALGTASR
ncbi:MAG TPA: tetratricopeptide repeat protein [Candidatus Binatia bacterium]|nr:tetratricopeptide repeat protein [Candidatus Binatia bacterium]